MTVNARRKGLEIQLVNHVLILIRTILITFCVYGFLFNGQIRLLFSGQRLTGFVTYPSLLISFVHQRSWPYQRTRPRRVSSCLPSTLHHRSSRSYHSSSGTTISSPLDRASSPGVSQQPNPVTQTILTGHWTRILLSYARLRRLFTLRVEDAESSESAWDEVLRNPRINRAYGHSSIRIFPSLQSRHYSGKLLPSHLENIMSQMVATNLAVYEPAKQTRSVQLYWRLPEEWAEVLHEWVRLTQGLKCGHRR